MLLGTAYFDSTGSTLTSESQIILARIVDKMRAEPNLMIDVRGYADNAGSSAANAVLSKKMADHVKVHLTVNSGLSGDRIQSFGYGSKKQKFSNKTVADRKQNHRVEIVIRKPDAVLTWFENDVKVQPPCLRPYWLDPVPNYYLYQDYKVVTGKKSSAHILYPKNGTLKIGEEATVIIQGLDLKQEENSFAKNLQLQDGALKAILEDAVSPEGSNSNTQAAESEPNTQSSTTQIDEKLENLIVAYQSDTGVASSHDKTALHQDDSVAIVQTIDRGKPNGFALGVIIGNPTGITIKTDIHKKHTIDLRIGWSLHEASFHVSCDYISYFPEWIEKEYWYPYLVLGGRSKIEQEQEDRQFNLGIRVGIGVEYVYRQFGLFGELCPVVELVPETNLDLEGGIGVRYYIDN